MSTKRLGIKLIEEKTLIFKLCYTLCQLKVLDGTEQVNGLPVGAIHLYSLGGKLCRGLWDKIDD